MPRNATGWLAALIVAGELRTFPAVQADYVRQVNRARDVLSERTTYARLRELADAMIIASIRDRP